MRKHLNDLYAGMMICLGVYASMCILYGQEPQPRFMVSEVESLKIENLKLKSQLLQTEIALHDIEIQLFVAKTLTDHGNPANVKWNPKTYSFEVVPTPASAVPPTSTTPKPSSNAPAVPKHQE